MNSIKKNIILTILLITLFALNEGASAIQIAFLYHPTNAPETPQISNDIRNDIQVIEYCTDMHYKYLPWIDGTEPYCCLHWNSTGCTVFTPDCKDYVADFICDEEKLPLALFDRKLFCYDKSSNRIIAITAKECKYQIVSPQLVSSSENLYFISMHQYGTLFVVSQGKPDFFNMQIKILQNGVVKEGPGRKRTIRDRKSTRLNSSHPTTSRMPSSA